MNKKKSSAIITIEKFPSRNEIIIFINNFIINNKINSNYEIGNFSDVIKINFSDKNIGYLFMNEFKKSFQKNELYKNISINLTEKKQNMYNSKSTSNILVKSKNGIYKKYYDSNIYNGSYFHKHMLDISKKAGVITNSSPYMSSEHREYIEKLKDKKKWVSDRDFITSVGRPINNKKIFVIKNYVSLTPSIPPLLYKFRNENKKKWITSKGFKLY